MCVKKHYSEFDCIFKRAILKVLKPRFMGYRHGDETMKFFDSYSFYILEQQLNLYVLDGLFLIKKRCNHKIIQSKRL